MTENALATTEPSPPVKFEHGEDGLTTLTIHGEHMNTELKRLRSSLLEASELNASTNPDARLESNKRACVAVLHFLSQIGFGFGRDEVFDTFATMLADFDDISRGIQPENLKPRTVDRRRGRPHTEDALRFQSTSVWMAHGAIATLLENTRLLYFPDDIDYVESIAKMRDDVGGLLPQFKWHLLFPRKSGTVGDALLRAVNEKMVETVKSFKQREAAGSPPTGPNGQIVADLMFHHVLRETRDNRDLGPLVLRELHQRRVVRRMVRHLARGISD
jgi:hypothetical protein